jgi:hypothetical protein
VKTISKILQYNIHIGNTIIMKQLVLGLLLTLSAVTIFSACRKKDKDTAKELDGNRSIVSIMKAQGPVSSSAMPQSVTLMSCNVKKDNCNGEWISNNGSKNNFFWSVSDKGETLSIIVDPSQPANQATSDLADYQGDYNIEELTDVKLLIKHKEKQITIEFSK